MDVEGRIEKGQDEEKKKQGKRGFGIIAASQGGGGTNVLP